MKQIKVLQIGCGKMSKYIMEYVYDLGGVIVGALDIDKNKLGLDIGSIIGSMAKGVIISDIAKLDEVIKRAHPDIAVITTESFLSDVKDLIRTCVLNSVNVITTSEECFYPSNSNPSAFKELDTLAKAYNVTITGCGYQDVFWGNLISTLSGSIHNVKKIKGSSSYNVEDYGIALARAHGAGLSLKDFELNIASADNKSDVEVEDIIRNGEFKPSYMWNTVGWLADKLSLTPKKIQSKCIPIVAEKEIESKTLNMIINKGNATGMSAVATLETVEGIIIEAECIGKVYTEEDFDKNEWTIYGDPDTTLTINRPDTVRLTCANIVNRIPDVIKAQSGFVPTSKMGEIKAILKY